MSNELLRHDVGWLKHVVLYQLYTRKRNLKKEHPDMLSSMVSLALTE